MKIYSNYIDKENLIKIYNNIYNKIGFLTNLSNDILILILSEDEFLKFNHKKIYFIKDKISEIYNSVYKKKESEYEPESLIEYEIEKLEEFWYKMTKNAIKDVKTSFGFYRYNLDETEKNLLIEKYSEEIINYKKFIFLNLTYIKQISKKVDLSILNISEDIFLNSIISFLIIKFITHFYNLIKTDRLKNLWAYLIEESLAYANSYKRLKTEEKAIINLMIEKSDFIELKASLWWVEFVTSIRDYLKLWKNNDIIYSSSFMELGLIPFSQPLQFPLNFMISRKLWNSPYQCYHSWKEIAFECEKMFDVYFKKDRKLYFKEFMWKYVAKLLIEEILEN